MAAIQCFFCWVPGQLATGLDESKSSGNLWSKVDFAHCQGTEPEDFISLGGPFLHFQKKVARLLCSNVFLRLVVFSRGCVRFTVNKLFQSSTVHYISLNLLPFLSQLKNVSSECQEPRACGKERTAGSTANMWSRVMHWKRKKAKQEH